MNKSRAVLIRIFVALPLLMLSHVSALAQGTTAAEPRLVLKGYDAVAYFTEQRPVKGAADYRADWDGARYHFATARNRDAFTANPDRYAPQFSGLCATALSMGKKVEADPALWKIIDGKLYVFSAPKGMAMVEKDPTLLTRSSQNWQAKPK